MIERLSDRRVWLGGGALAAVLVVALSWFALIGPRLSSAHDLTTQAASARQQNDALSAKGSSLKAKSGHVATYTSSLRTALSRLPYSSGLPTFTRQVNAQAVSHHVTLDSVTVGGVTPVVTGTTTQAATSATPGTGTVAGAPATAAGGLFSMQVTLKSTGALRDQLAFLTAVRTTGPRRALVTTTQVAPGQGSKASVDQTSTVTTQVTIFAAPRTPEQVKQLRKLLAGDLDG